MEFKTGLKLASVILASTFVLAACGSDDTATKESTVVAESETLQDGSYL